MRVIPSLSHIEAIRDTLASQQEEQALSRVRGRQKGYVRREGPSWFVTYREYRRDESGEWQDERVTEYLGPAEWTLKQAMAKAKPLIDRANRAAEKPSINMLVADFIERYFRPHVERTKKQSGKLHYRYLLDSFIVPGLGQRQMADVGMRDIHALIDRAAKKYSRQTQLHIKNAVSALFKLAIRMELYERANPASLVEVGEVVHTKRSTYDTTQLAAVLVHLPSPIYEMALLGAEASLGPAELCGLQVRHANLSPDPVIMDDGVVVAPNALYIHDNWVHGVRGTLKRDARRRIVPLSGETAERLRAVIAAAPQQGPDAPVFQSRRGTPIDRHNISNRMFKGLSETLGFPVTWYGFRRAHSSLAAITAGDATPDRKLIMGHTRDAMSEYYDIQDVERLRGLTRRISEAVRAAEDKARSGGKLVAMRKKAG